MSPTGSASAARVPDGALAMVEFVRSLPYARPSARTTAAMLAERRGTCSTKHAFLHQLLSEHFPELEPRLVHRVYAVSRQHARVRFGSKVSDTVPCDGLMDVHRFLEIRLHGRPIRIDATFPGSPWDGATSMPLACGAGEDHPVGGDPDEEKRALESEHCDPRAREPFIAALSAVPARSSAAGTAWYSR